MVDTMIRLFESTETSFLSNGLGSLPDVSKCEIVEERNGSFELEMNYHISGKRYADLKLRRIIAAKPNPYADPQPFRIYSISKPMNGLVTVKAEHISYDMAGYPVSRFTASTAKETFLKLKSEVIVENCPFDFSTDLESECEFAIQKPASMRSLLGGSTGSILDIYGGEYEFDGYNIILHTKRGADRGVTIRYGKNMTDMNQEENCSNVYTAVYPYFIFEDKDTEQSILVELPERTVSTPGVYDFIRIYPLDVSSEWKNSYEWNDEYPSEEEMKEIAEKYISDNGLGTPKVSLTVSFEQLSQSKEYAALEMLETVRLCDTVSVEFPKLGVSASSKCIKTTYNVLTGKYVSIELGEARSNLANSIVSQNHTVGEKIDKLPTRPFVAQEVEKAAKIISGSLNGYVAVHSSVVGSNSPDEILIMDTNDIATAKKVWKWNSQGLGYSDQGYTGSFVTVITDTGKVIADYIKGSLTIGGTGNTDGRIEIKNQYNQILIKLDKNGIAFSNGGKQPVADIVKETVTTEFVNDLDISVPAENLTGTVIMDKELISRGSGHCSEIKDGVIKTTLISLSDKADIEDTEPVTLDKDTLQGILQEIADLKQGIADLILN